jgi:hypothetical protein
MPRITGAQVARYAYAAGFHDSQLVTAVAVSFAENGSHDTRAVNHNSDGSTDSGLWQINSVHRIPQSQLFDPARNAQAAWDISHQGNDFTAWTTYNSGASGNQENAAIAAIDAANISGQGSAGGITGAVGSAGNTLHNAETNLNPLAWGAALAKFLATIADRGFWIRVLEIVGGLLLGFGGLVMLAKASGAGDAVAGVAAKAAPLLAA